MKLVILAGGLGTRFSEETFTKPKPMIEIGGYPILWHIMKIYSTYGVNEFVICLGYKGYMIKEYFANYFLHTSDVTIDVANNKMHINQTCAEPWKVTLVDTGPDTMTGGRIKRILPYVENEECFCLTYGDGVSNINVSKLIEFHLKRKRLVTVTATKPAGRFGALKLNSEDEVLSFKEKPRGDGDWINGGFFVLSPEAINYIDDDATTWESTPLETLAQERQISAYKHGGFWYAMDTLRDNIYLEKLWKNNEAPWKTWS